MKRIPSALRIKTDKVKKSFGEKVIFSIVFVLFAIYAAAILYPLVYLVFVSMFMDAENYIFMITGIADVSLAPHFENYINALNISVLDSVGNEVFMPQMFFNSIWYCFFSIAGGVLMSCFTGYVVAKYKFRGRGLIYAVAIFCMTIPIVGTGGAAFKLIFDLGLYNTPIYIIVASLGGFGFNFLIMYAFFKNVSWSYVEAVLIDGGGHFTAFFKVMLPQAKPSLITLAILAFIGCWNDYSTPLLYLPDYPTVASGVYQIQTAAERSGETPLVFAGLALSIIPVIILFAICSERIMKNLSIGGLKG
ncbi:MAG: carbohydrate ABC transporter permease [Bacilli bacterium]|nr:carbohydrate ABC transporter permease [Bacilli bacterium]